MRNLMKRASVLVTAAMMLIGSFQQVGGAEETLSPNAYGLYPTAAYTTVSAELDTTGAWKYRELVPDVACEEENSFVNRGSNNIQSGASTKQTNAMRIDTDKYAGNYSWYRRAITSRGIGFEIPSGIMKKGQNFISSAWLRSDMEGATEGTPAERVAVRPFVNWVDKEASLGTNVKITNEWVKYDLSFTVPDAYDEEKPFRVAVVNADTENIFDSTTNDSYSEKDSSGRVRPVYSIYLDEWSLRMALPDTFPASYVKSISPSPAKPVINNGEDLTFKFSLDIDPRTVRKENITVNGTANSPLVKAVNVNTDEATRETALTISFNTLEEGTAYKVALPEIKDAWGRDVVGTTTASVACVPADAEYTIYEDLDESGAWKYRNLVPDEECESLDGFVSKGSNTTTNKAQTNVKLSTDKHSGNYSIMRGTRNNAGIGFEIDTIEIDPAEYYVSAWIKSDCYGEGCQNVPVDFARNYNYNGSATEASFDGGGNKFLATTQWNYFSKTVKQTGKPDSDKKVTIYFLNSDINYGIVEGNRHVQNIYVDDWNFRLIPSWNVNATGISVNGNTAVFTFDKDIDKWTVTADKLLVNGKVNNGTITSAVVDTNEITRVTTLTVTATQNIDDDFVISLPAEARDAWGREIAGIKSTGLFYEEKITDASGTVLEVTDMTAGTRNYVIENIVNNTSKEINMTAIIALYNTDKTLESCDIDSVRLAPGQTAEEIKASITIPALSEGMSVKCFLWNMDSLCPIK